MNRYIPYGKHYIEDDDIAEVVKVLKSDWLTTGPKVDEFENAVASFCESKYAVAVNSGTAALHAACFAAGISRGDEVIVTPMTFVASVNCVLYCNGIPVFIDVEENTLLINPSLIEQKITPKTKAIIAVDYAGQPCNYDALLYIAKKYNLVLISDACHSIGSVYKNKKTGSIADITVFSFHPVKHITTGEGGMILTNNMEYAQKCKVFRNHGITTDFKQREQMGTWFYEMTFLGYNYRITDFQCALGMSQLKKLPIWLRKRNYIASLYNEHFKDNFLIKPLELLPDRTHAFHLYVVKIDFKKIRITKSELFKMLRNKGIGVNVHYIPVHLHPYYINNLKTAKGLCPVAEKVYEEIITLPIFPQMNEDDVNYIANTLKEIVDKNIIT
ncbi:MAG: UDP-4-amino-4,6-dideoxy-N-acetyl-beta-L-altrosamine transaminase [Bacteroidales bacterium]|nr:UDP-4-amino-4,6-dideoxy-N-acetyl-beta-L-altrosamine transaminase [Bacteroidales bacterium]